MPHGFNHVALATKDIGATRRFYTEVMGFTLAKVVAGATPGGGWSRHVFFDCGGGQLMAWWDIHDPKIGDAFPTDLNKSIGLPEFVNHLAWHAPDEAAFDAALHRWLAHGIAVAEVDHGFCRSIYTTDPNGIMVEFCLMVRALDDEDRAEAERLLAADVPPLEGPPPMRFHEPAAARA